MKTRTLAVILLLMIFTGRALAQTLPPIRYGSFTDPRDGQKYKTIRIGSLEFMAQNLNYHAGKGCWVYNNDPSQAVIYGRLYNWEAAKNASPTGWHLPTDAEW